MKPRAWLRLILLCASLPPGVAGAGENLPAGRAPVVSPAARSAATLGDSNPTKQDQPARTVRRASETGSTLGTNLMGARIGRQTPQTNLVVSQRPPAPARPDEEAGQLRVDDHGRITLHFDDLDVRRALELVSREAKLNILIAAGVAGRITINLEDATLEQTLDAILSLSGLVARQENGLIYIYTPDEYAAVDQLTQKVVTRVYRLNYVRSTDLLAMIQPLLSERGVVSSTPESREGISESPAFSTGSGSGGGGGGGGSGGGGGGIGGSGSTGGNSLAGSDVLIVKDFEANLRTVDEVLRQLDIQPIQVLIEAVLLSVELDRQNELGVNFAVVDNLGRTLAEVGNSAELTNNVGFTPLQIVSAVGATAGKIKGGSANGLTSNTNGIKFGFIGPNTTAFVRALESLGEVNVLASPRLLVLNKQRADIQLGRRLGYRTLSQNLTSTIQQIQFLNTGTLLRLRPFVSNDRMIRMEIHPERSSGEVIDELPRQNTSEVTTNVMIPDGATLVIGGLIENEDTYDSNGLPGLNRMPAIGAIFGFRRRTNVKRELIVMLTPHIWDPNCVPGLNAPLAEAAEGPAPAANTTSTESNGLPGSAGTAHSSANSKGPTRTAAIPNSRPATGGLRTALRGYTGWPRRAPHPATSQGPAPKAEPVPVASTPPAAGVMPASLNTRTTTVQIAPPVDTAVMRASGSAEPQLRPRETPRVPTRAAADGDPGRAGPRVAATGNGRPEGGPRTPTDARPNSLGSVMHSVRPGETLERIALERLGNPNRSNEIQQLNQDTIVDSRRLIPGQLLALPSDAAPAR